MRKCMLIASLSLLLLMSACSTQQKKVSAVEVIKSEGIQLTEIQSSNDTDLDGIKPMRYKLDSEEIIMVYDFGSNEKRELGEKHFQEHQQILSSYAPIVFKADHYLVLYYNNVNSTTATAKLTETKYGEKIQKAINQIE
jgi:hypothetical protein